MDAVAARRNRMQVRVYPSLSAHDRDDASYWAALPVAERVLQVWKLSEAQWRLSGEFPQLEVILKAALVLTVLMAAFAASATGRQAGNPIPAPADVAAPPADARTTASGLASR